MEKVWHKVIQKEYKLVVGVAEVFRKSLLVLSLSLNIVSFVGKPGYLFQGN